LQAFTGWILALHVSFMALRALTNWRKPVSSLVLSYSAADSCAFHLFHFNDISTLLYLTYILLHRYIVKERTHPFNGPLSGTTRVIRYQKGKTNLDFTEARDSEWQWHQLDHMQVCTSLLADNHASTPPLIFYRVDALPDTWYIVKEQGCNLLMFVWCLFLLLYSYCLYY